MSLVKMVQFFQAASSYVEPDAETIELSGEHADRALGYHRTIIRVSGLLGAIGFGLGVTCLVMAWITAKPGDTKAEDEAYGMILMPPMFAIIGIVFGVALSCLFAPREFLLGPVGQKWMKLIGTESVLVSRIVCGILTIIAVGVPTALGLVIWLKP